MAELAGTYGNGRRMVQTFCSSVLGVPISLGAIQKVLDRVSQAINPHYTSIATLRRAKHRSITLMKRPGIVSMPWNGSG